MAEALNQQADPAAGTVSPPVIETEPAKPVSAKRPHTRAERARRSAYQHRFAIVYFLLAVIAGGAVGALVVLLERSKPAPKAAWSDWHPSGTGTARILEIADHIPKDYRLANGDPLVIAHASAPSVPSSANGQQVDVPVRQIQILPTLDTVDASSTIQFALCGLGANCAIESTASAARYALLRREAVEMALFTFRYVAEVKSVELLLPPLKNVGGSSGSVTQAAIFLERSDVKHELQRPFSSSFAEKTPRIGHMSNAETQLVNQITQPRIYAYDYTQTQDGSVIQLMKPLGQS